MAKARWDESLGSPPGVHLPEAASEVIAAAHALTRDQVERLDAADRQHAGRQSTAWDLLRDRLDGAGYRDLRLEVRNKAWEAVCASLRALDIPPPADDGYWRVGRARGQGAARAARFAACAAAAGEVVDAEVVEVLRRSWDEVFRPGRPLAG